MSGLWRAFHLVFFIISLVSPPCVAQTGSTINVPIPNNSPQIVYTPFVCGTDNASFAECPWRTLNVDGETVVTSGGPGLGNNIIPQMFFTFRATALFMTTPTPSNATLNITVTTGSFVVSKVANSSAHDISIQNLRESDTTTLSITFLPTKDQSPSRLDIGTISILVSNDNNTSSFLPTQTLPPSISLPEFTTPPEATPTPSNDTLSDVSRRKMIALAVGLTVGLGLGLTSLCVLIFILWRRRRWRTYRDGFEDSRSQPAEETRRSQFF